MQPKTASTDAVLFGCCGFGHCRGVVFVRGVILVAAISVEHKQRRVGVCLHGADELGQSLHVDLRRSVHQVRVADGKIAGVNQHHHTFVVGEPCLDFLPHFCVREALRNPVALFLANGARQAG